MSWSSEVVYNRTDCPYGCGRALPAKLRWSATPCPGCQRPLYPLRALQDDQGEDLWPPQDVPRPPLVSPQGAVVWYVVGKEGHAEWARIHNDLASDRERKSRGEAWFGGCVTAWLGLWMVVDIIGYAVLGLLRLLRRILFGSDHKS